MAKLVGVIASILVGLALATGVTVAVAKTSAPDKGVDLESPALANNMSSDGDSDEGGIVNYGSRP